MPKEKTIRRPTEPIPDKEQGLPKVSRLAPRAKKQFAVFDYFDDKLVLAKGELSGDAPRFGSTDHFDPAVLMERFQQPEQFEVIATKESREYLLPLEKAGIDLFTIPRADAIHHLYREQAGSEPCLVLSVGKNRTIGSVIVGDNVSSRDDISELTLRGILKKYIDTDARAWVTFQSAKNSAFEKELLDTLAAVWKTGREQKLGKIPIKPIELTSSAEALTKFIKKLDPQHKVQTVILTDWAATNDRFESFLEGKYTVLRPPANEAFEQALKGLLSYEQIWCCPEADCSVELVPRSERRCRRCSAALEPATLSLWERKCVAPELAQAQPSLAIRSHLLELARRMGLVARDAVTRLDEYIQLNPKKIYSAAEVNADSPPPEPIAESVQKEPVKRAIVSPERVIERAKPAPKPEEPHRRIEWVYKRIIIIVTALALVAITIVLITGFFSRGRSTVAAISETPTPPPSSPPPTPTPTVAPTPEMNPGMVPIPGGEFLMGRSDGEAQEAPVHKVTVDPFLMDKYEVQCGDYQKCVEAGKCRVPEGWNGGVCPANQKGLPVTGVTWQDANDYAAFVGKRLPTEAEWEFAARGSEGRRYPWGNYWSAGLANIGTQRLMPVGQSRGTTPLGLADMIGNAQEWTASEFREYPNGSGYFQTGRSPEQLRVIRGGSYLDAPARVTATSRNALRMNGESYYTQTGFRCAKDVK